MNQNFIVTKIERVALVGIEEYPDDRISFSPDMKCNELIFHFSGNATVFFDEMVLKTKKDTIRFLPKGNVLKYEVFQEPGECILIDFQTDTFVSEKAFVIDMPKNESIRLLFQKIFSYWSTKENGYYFNCISLLYKILAELQLENHTFISHQKIMQPAIDAIHDGFLKDDITIFKLATMCGISQSYFKRIFKEKYNISPKKYIIMLKINHACELLRQKQYSISQVSEFCNYSDIYFFSRQFKEYMGITPTQFIKKYRSSK